MLSTDYILHILKTECAYKHGDSVLVGVSGGADSVALLHLLQAANVPVAAAHVNYGLRGDESDGDEKFVSELCAKLNVPLYTRQTNRSALEALHNNLQKAARTFRFSFFDEIASKESMNFIALAHHADDQLETVLINFLRGSGLSGMTGMSFIDPYDGVYIRPMLDVNREEIEKYLRRHNLEWREDSSNQTDDYLRNRIRHNVIPAINSVDERDGKGWKHTIHQLSNINALVGTIIMSLVKNVPGENGLTFQISRNDLLEYANPEIVFNSILHSFGFTISFNETEFPLLLKQQVGKKYFSGNMQLTVDRERWIVSENGTSQRQGFDLAVGEEIHGWECSEKIIENPAAFSGFEAVLNSNYKDEAIAVRTWKHGDQLQPFGFSGTKKVSDVLTEIKVPSNEKEYYPVLTINDEVAWIPGYRIAEKYKVTPETKSVLHIKWNR